jgi:hypothetical protein
MTGGEVWSVAAIGFCCGLFGREVLSGWGGLIRDAVAHIRPPAAPPAAEPAPNPTTQADDVSTLQAWGQLNPWYAADTGLCMEAQLIHRNLRHREPHLTLAASLAEVTLEMHRRHPEIVPTRQ